jgi:hypothetical protein
MLQNTLVEPLALKLNRKKIQEPLQAAFKAI